MDLVPSITNGHSINAGVSLRMMGKDAHCIAANPEEDSVSKADKAAKTRGRC
jgi:hypothetical protein